MNTVKRKVSAGHISAVAAELFYKEGISVVGVDRIAAEANVTKRTLYRYFPSKDELVAAALREPIAIEFPREGSPSERVVGAFRAMGEFLVQQNFRGCPYINATAELVSRRHPARAIIVEATAKRRRWFRARAVDAGAIDPDMLAEQIEALFDGSLAGATKRAELRPIDAACAAVESLLSAARPRSTPNIPQRSHSPRVTR